MLAIFSQSQLPLELPFITARSRRSRSSSDRLPPCCVSCQKMSSESANTFPSVGTVTISYSDLKDKNRDLSAKIEEGFGPDGLGIISISEVPGLSFLRESLLRLSPRVASLPNDVKKGLEDPDSRYNFGWSHGKEKLESGKLDTFKGSFYANPILDIPTTDVSLTLRYPSYCRPNKWPTTALPELEVAFKALGKLMFDVGLMLAYQCDQYVSKEIAVQEDEGLEQILKRSRCHKGRLLYYFPRQQSVCMDDVHSMSSWCGWHTDHGSLTGLTCGIFMRNSVKITCPDSAAGLYIRARNNQIVKVVLGEDEIAYQIGEITELLSRGRLCATPHCVQAPKGDKAFGVERSTFALFMQPDWDENLKIPRDIHHHQEFVPQKGTLSFGEYSEKKISEYYHQMS